jgi:pSer/pThr/pTyr-binding forkhead associated (FHA) protein
MNESSKPEERDDATVVFVPHDVAVDAVEDELGVRIEGVPQGVGVLIVRRGPDSGSHYMLDRPTTLVGRNPDAELFLDDITVSRRHVEIVRHDSQYVVRDLGSLNGTYINRERVEEATLHNGDELQVGKFRMVFVSAASHVAAGEA